MKPEAQQNTADANRVGSTGGSASAWPLPPRIEKPDGSTVRTFDAPHTKEIEFCDNRGCAFNANTGKCSSTIGQCYGYVSPNNAVSGGAGAPYTPRAGSVSDPTKGGDK